MDKSQIHVPSLESLIELKDMSQKELALAYDNLLLNLEEREKTL